MIYFRSDYSQGAHPDVLKALIDTNLEHSDGYAMDQHSENAAQMIKDLIGRDDCQVYMMVGGTPSNIITITAALKPWEAVVAPKSSHIYTHECGGVEAAGHKIMAFEAEDGKLTPAHIEAAWDEFEDDHTVLPKMASISNTTELGTVYTKSELGALRKCCDEHDMYLYMDGARLGTALTCEDNDMTIKDIAQLVDGFYIGGTKNGALFGEAMIIFDDDINDHYRWVIKQHCGMLAKGRLIGVQFEALLKGGQDSIYFTMAAHANAMAKKLRVGIEKAGYSFLGNSHTNQMFPILPAAMVAELNKDFFFYEWAPEKDGFIPIRLVTAWGTTEEDVNAFLEALDKLK